MTLRQYGQIKRPTFKFKTKLKHHFIKDNKFKKAQSAQKLRFDIKIKDQIRKLMKFYVAYQFNYPVCNDSYIGKIKRNLSTRTEKHACSNRKSAIYNHIN